jgi:hypothetical protein
MVKKTIFILLLMLLITIPNIFALSIGPSKTVKYFKPHMSETFSVIVTNNEEKEVNSEVYLFGELSKYSNFQKQRVLFKSGESKIFNFSLNLPEELGPGDHRVDFVAGEIAKKENTNFIGVLTSVGSVFVIRVPYEGYYLKASLDTTSVSAGEVVPFILTMENLGSFPIDGVKGVLEIYDSSDVKIDNIQFNTSLGLNEIKKIELRWDSGNNSFGNYRAKAILSFNGKTVETETLFKLGDVHISILGFDNKIISRKINKFHVEIKSDWGDNLEDVFAKLEIFSNTPLVYKSENFNIDPWSTKDVVIYVDADKISPGNYPARIGVVYKGVSTQEDFELAVRSFSFSPQFSNFLIVAIAIIVVALIIYFMFIKRRIKDGKNH